MRDAQLLSLLAGYRRQYRVVSLCAALMMAAPVAGVVLVAAALVSGDAIATRASGIAAFIGTAVLRGVWSWRHWTARRVARALERRAALDNLVITAEEVAGGRTHVRHRAIREELIARAVERLQHLGAASVRPLVAPVLWSALAAMSFVVLVLAVGDAADTARPSDRRAVEASFVSLSPGDLRVTVVAPSYTARETAIFVNPTIVRAVEGSTIRLEVRGTEPTTLVDARTGQEQSFGVAGDHAVLELFADASRPLLVRQHGDSGTTAERLVQLDVDSDQRPVVAIREPGKDLMFAEGRGQVPIQIDARDDIGLRALALRFTRVAGSGETFTFEEGEWPIAIARTGSNAWTARATLSLEQLKLQDGDTLVYRAIAHDAKPGADPAASDTYVVEIGRLAGVASQGFALPEERDRQAISQQMLIIKTERLQSEQPRLSAEAFLDQARLLAVEQRMVKAEFVFMTGGHVEDEVAEAEHSHELAEGRMENTAQVELLTAIREMSRAEARLNAGDTVEALRFERAALQALQRAFDRRRYLLRTLPERTRIDPARRLTGDLETARSSTRSGVSSNVTPAEPARALLAELAAQDSASRNLAPLAARLLALQPDADSLQQAALQLTAARGDDARREALRQAQRAVAELLRQRLPDRAPLSVERDPITGRLVQELSQGVRR